MKYYFFLLIIFQFTFSVLSQPIDSFVVEANNLMNQEDSLIEDDEREPASRDDIFNSFFKNDSNITYSEKNLNLSFDTYNVNCPEFKKASKFLKLKDYSKAANAFRKSLKKDPSFIYPYSALLLIKSLHNNGKNDDALNLYKDYSITANTIPLNLAIPLFLDITKKTENIEFQKEILKEYLSIKIKKDIKARIRYRLAQIYTKESKKIAFPYYVSLLKRNRRHHFADSAAEYCYKELKNKYQTTDDYLYIVLSFMINNGRSKDALTLFPSLKNLKYKFRKNFLLLKSKARYNSGQYKKTLKLLKYCNKYYGASQQEYLRKARSYRKLNNHKLARKIYRQFIKKYPKSSSLSRIYWWMGFTAEENGNEKEAKKYYKLLTRLKGKSKNIQKGAFRIGYLNFLQKNYKTSILEFKKYIKRFPSGKYYSSSVYWIARSYEKLSKPELASTEYIKVVSNAFYTYYSYRSKERLRQLDKDFELDSLNVLRFGNVEDFLMSLPSYKNIFYSELISQKDKRNKAIISLCRILNFSESDNLDLLKYEVYKIKKILNNDYIFMYNFIQQLAKRGHQDLAFRLTRPFYWRIEQRRWKEIPPNLAKLIYPRYFGVNVEKEAVKYDIDPLFIHGLIRQESMYDFKILSPVGAVGLMQIMPYTGVEIAGRLKQDNFSRDSLFVPSFNIAYGTYYVSLMRKKFNGSLELTLCAYNAGPTAAKRWLNRNGKLSYDHFVEAIGYSETRDYVKKCMSNFWTYRMLWY